MLVAALATIVHIAAADASGALGQRDYFAGTPYEAEARFNYTSTSPQTLKKDLKGGDKIKLTRIANATGVEAGQVRVGITNSENDWWKALNRFNGDYFDNEVVAVSKKGVFEYAVLKLADVRDIKFNWVLSKAGELGAHTNMYLLDDFEKMVERSEYLFDWQCDKHTWHCAL